MIVIRLKRGGRTNKDFFFIVVMDKRSRRDGKALDVLGFYNPTPAGAQQKIEIKNLDTLKSWIAKGAQLTETVKRLVKESGITLN